MKFSLVVVFALAAFLSVDAVEVPTDIQTAINNFLLPYLNKAENWVHAQYTPEVQEKLRNAVHKDLTLLQKVVSPDNIKKTEDKLIEIINNPRVVVTDASNLIHKASSYLP